MHLLDKQLSEQALYYKTIQAAINFITSNGKKHFLPCSKCRDTNVL